MRGRSIINVCDQTEVLFPSSLGRLSDDLDDLGVIGTGMQYGKNAVVGLVLDEGGRIPQGLSSLSFHSRHPSQTSSRAQGRIQGMGRDERPLRYRESSKWLEAVEHCAQRLDDCSSIVHVIDREADDLNFYLRLFREDGVLEKVSACNDLLIRLKNDRWVAQAGGKARRLSDLMAELPSMNRMLVYIGVDNRLSVSFHRDEQHNYQRRVEWKQKRAGRLAVVEVKYLQGKMDEGKNTGSKSDMPATMLKELVKESTWFDRQLSFIQLLEVESIDTKTRQPIHVTEADKVNWMLMTTLQVPDGESAMRTVSYYSGRFRAIEPLFRLLKSEGFNIEAAQQKSVASLLKITAMALKASAMALKLVEVRNCSQGYPITETFNEREIKVLTLLQTQYSGSTLVRCNPYDPGELAWAAWIIARMGGWKPENKQRPPGPITMLRGLEMFNAVFKGVALANGWEWEKDVSQP